MTLAHADVYFINFIQTATDLYTFDFKWKT